MNVLLLGSGAREHALAWKLASSPTLGRLFALPGNPGIARYATALEGSASDPALVTELAKRHDIGLVVVGPEAPLVAGVADALRAAGVPVFGPDKAAARLEGSKAFAKEVMAAANVPTARSEVFTEPEAAAQRALTWGPVVVKADGLAQGKGVIVASSGDEAAQACRQLGTTAAGSTLVLEEKLEGPELSLIALCDGQRCQVLPGAHDAKRLLDGNLGPNTGGMGAYAPSPRVSAAELEALAHQTIAPILVEMQRRGTPFIGALYAGLMLTPNGPRVLEYNCRFGDPETQVLMPLLDEDAVALFLSCAQGRLEAKPLRLVPGAAVGVVLAAPGYPEAPKSGAPIEGLDQALAAGALIFEAGTALKEGQRVTSGGRVLTVTALGPSLAEARQKAYAAADLIRFTGLQRRGDIAHQSW